MRRIPSAQHSCTAPDTHRPQTATRPAAFRLAATRFVLAIAVCLLLGGFAAEFLASCNRRPLEVYYIDKARVVLDVDWQTEFGYRPNGMTVHVYDDSGALYQAFSTNDVDTAQLSLAVGRYTVIVFNEDMGAFGSFGFDGADRLEDFRVVARTNSSRSAAANNANRWDVGTRYAWEPAEVLGRAITDIEITQEMLDRQLKFIDYHYRDQAYTHWAEYRYPAVVQPLQTMIHIRVHVNGMEYMYRMETSLSGMADGCSLPTRWRNTTTCNVFYDSDRWGYTFDNPGASNGWVGIDIPTWGEPHGKEKQEWRVPSDNVLRMNFTLRDRAHTEEYFEFDVGDLIEYHDPQQNPNQLTPPDVLRHLYLTINREIPLLPSVDPEEEMGAGFNAWVDPWDYGGEVDLGTF